MLFQKTETLNTLPALTSEQAKAIYEGLKTKDINNLFLEDNIPTEYSEEVNKEMKRIESEILSKMRGTFLITPAVAEQLDENEEVLVAAVEAVYFELTTKTALLASLSSDLLDVEYVLEDVEDYSIVYKEGRTWVEFKELVTN